VHVQSSMLDTCMCWHLGHGRPKWCVEISRYMQLAVQTVSRAMDKGHTVSRCTFTAC
jgi:hypothetical protein